MDKEIEENKKETLPDMVERYFLDNHKEKEHIKNILWKVFNEHNSSGLYRQLYNSIRKSPRFLILARGWIQYVGTNQK
jgi:hypothetical protein